MQINNVQNSPSFQGWANKKLPNELVNVIKNSTSGNIAKRKKCFELAKNIGKDNLYVLNFNVNPNNNKLLSITATSGDSFAKTKTFKTGIFKNRDVHGLLNKVNKFLAKEKKNYDKTVKMFGMDFELNGDYQKYIKTLRKDLGEY